MVGTVTQAWRDSRARFEHLREFINESYRPDAHAEYRRSAYSSWILLAYAAAEASFVEAAKAAISIIGTRVPSPSNLPEKMRRLHRERTIRYLLNDVTDSAFVAAIGEVESQDWATSSRLLSIDRNVWVSEIKSWFSRLDGDSTIDWLSSETAENGETLASIWDDLVRLRNDIAHGRIPTELSNGEVVSGLILSYEKFVRHSVTSLHRALANFLGTEHSQTIGTIDKDLQLGAFTLPIKEVHSNLMIGDHVLLVDDFSRVRVGHVRSMKHFGTTLQQANPGMSEVAVGLSCEHRDEACLEAF